MEWEGLRRLYERERQGLLIYLYTLCGDRAAAEDLLQETFLKAFFSLSAQHANARAWLYCVARNLYFDSRKKKRAPTAVPPPSESPEEALIRSENRRALYRALSKLEPRKREVLTLYYFGGMSQREIGAALNIRPDYVRVLACRAKKELKQLMEEDGYELP